MKPRHLLLVCSVACLAGPAFPQYKVIAPDGRVTYTDRPPVAESGKVTSIGRRAAPAPEPAGAGLPFELRQTVSRYPVTLYAGSNCIPCDSARQFLQQRGVPYSERRVLTAEDTAALERLTGGRTIPALTVGSQPLRGYNPTDWTTYIDAAGYPAESRLPRGWQAPAATPLVARQAAASEPQAAAAPPAAPARAPAAPAAPAADTEPPAGGTPTVRF
jgi:hypothetical protein